MSIATRLLRLEQKTPETCDCPRDLNTGRRYFVVKDERDAAEAERGRTLHAQWEACQARHDDAGGLLVTVRHFSAPDAGGSSSS